jgi:uncharacterized PurR-regulated membrane protein YhhQ (DUF165 family)
MRRFLLGSLTPTYKRSQYDAVFSIAARKSVVLAFAFHLLVITSSNYLVQLPISIFGFIPPGARSVSRLFSSPPI